MNLKIATGAATMAALLSLAACGGSHYHHHDYAPTLHSHNSHCHSQKVTQTHHKRVRGKSVKIKSTTSRLICH